MIVISPSALAGNYFLRGMSDDHLGWLATVRLRMIQFSAGPEGRFAQE
jgi:hypothetical protein